MTEQDSAELGRRRDNHCISDNKNRLQSQLTAVELFTRALLLWSRCTAIALRKHRGSKQPTSRLRHRLLHILSSYGPPKSPTLSSLMSLQTSCVCKDASRLWMPIALAADVLKCNALYDNGAYHAAFCPSTPACIHDGIVRELRDCIRAAGGCVL